jgi:Fe-S-cluster formation regulator IscX/YfhJ
MRYGDINIQWLRRIDNELYIRLIESFEERYKKCSEDLFEAFFSNTLEFNGCKPYVFTLDELKDDVQKIKSIYQE